MRVSARQRASVCAIDLLCLSDELIGALPSPLFLLRDKLAKSFLLGGGRMTTDSGEPKEMDSFLAIAEERGLWHAVNHPEIQAWSQRVLAISMQKLVDVLVRLVVPPSCCVHGLTRVCGNSVPHLARSASAS